MEYKNKNLPRTWDKLSYTGADRVPPAAEPDAMSWYTFFLKRNENGEFLDPEGNPICAHIITPNNRIDFEGEQLTIVKRVQKNLTNKQKAIAKYWAAGPASKQWTPIIDRLIDTYNISAPRAGRILGSVYGAMNDAYVLAWYYKYLWNVARPNQLDQNFKPFLCMPEHPSYPSGHAVIAGCVEVVLSYFFQSESKKLKELAEECAVSRLYAGVHYPIDNDEGLRLGRYIGELVVNMLKKQTGSGQNCIDYPITEYKDAELNPPPYDKQVIPYDYDNKCRSSVTGDKKYRANAIADKKCRSNVIGDKKCRSRSVYRDEHIDKDY